MNDKIRGLEAELLEDVKRMRRELAETEKALAAIQRLTTSSSKPARKPKRRPVTRDEVLAHVRRQDGPVTTGEVAKAIGNGSSTESISKTLGALVKSGELEVTGIATGMRGRRRLYRAVHPTAEAVMADAG